MKFRNARFLLVSAAIGGLLSVALGAFGAHALQSSLTAEQMATYETAGRYLIYHSLALLALSGIVLARPTINGLGAVGMLWVAGSAVFSGSLYILCLTEIRWLAWLTPVGGMLLIVGWLRLAIAGCQLGDTGVERH